MTTDEIVRTAESARPQAGVMHVVAFKWASGTTPAVVQQIKSSLDSMALQLDAITSYRCGANLGYFDDSWDFALVAIVTDFDKLVEYLEHPLHVEIATRLVAPVMADRVAVQISVELDDPLVRTPVGRTSASS